MCVCCNGVLATLALGPSEVAYHGGQQRDAVHRRGAFGERVR